MFISYFLGGFIPLSSYLAFSIERAVPMSVIVTFAGLFALGAVTTVYTKKSWVKTGLRMLALGGIALATGLLVGGIAAAVRR